MMDLKCLKAYKKEGYCITQQPLFISVIASEAKQSPTLHRKFRSICRFQPLSHQ